eukprot:COSAG02_NODE_18053_length_964_cov_1.063584_1_plen_55_part_01
MWASERNAVAVLFGVYSLGLSLRIWANFTGWVGIVWSPESSLINTAIPSDHLESL